MGAMRKWNRLATAKAVSSLCLEVSVADTLAGRLQEGDGRGHLAP